MNSHSAQQLLSEVTRLQSEARRPRADIWFPLIVYGTVNAIAVPVVLLIGRDHLGSYFLPGTILAGALCAIYYHRASLATGVGIPPAVWLFVLLAATVVGALCSFLGRQRNWEILNLGGPFIALLSGYLVLWWWTRNRLLLAIIVAALVVIPLCLSRFSGDMVIAVQLAFLSLLMLVAGAMSYRQEMRGINDTSLQPIK